MECTLADLNAIYRDQDSQQNIDDEEPAGTSIMDEMKDDSFHVPDLLMDSPHDEILLQPHDSSDSLEIDLDVEEYKDLDKADS